MKQLDKNEPPEYRLVEHELGTAQVLKAVNKTENKALNKENKKVSPVSKETEQNLKEAQESRQKARLLVREAHLKLMTAEAKRRSAEIIVEKAKEQMSIAVERARQISQIVVKAKQKEREAEERSQKANLQAEEAVHKLKQAEENKRMANFACDEYSRQVQAAEKNQRMAYFVVEEAKLREKYHIEEAGQRALFAAEEPESKTISADHFSENNIAIKELDKPVAVAKLISPDDTDFIDGSVNLLIDPGAQGKQILRLIYSLSSYAEIQIVSIEKSAEEEPRIELFINKSMPLVQTLYRSPVVQQIIKKSREFKITLRPDG
jgi:hypothetical protein